jgi:lipopolysaccharide transport system permease protein
MIDQVKELWRFRALIGALVVRHLSIRYRGSVLGFLWSFLNPLCLMLVYFVVFKFYIRYDSVPNYTIFLFCGLLPWLWFTSAVSEGTTSIVSSGHLITKSMFPPHVLPTVAVLTTLVNFLLSLPLLFIFMAFAGMDFHAALLGLPLVIGLQFLFLLGLALGLGSLNVQYRDVQHLVTNLLTFLFFLCPILYPVTAVPEQFRFTLDINPLALFTVFYHSLILDGVWPAARAWIYLTGWVVVVLLAGHAVFNRHREGFAESL